MAEPIVIRYRTGGGSVSPSPYVTSRGSKVTWQADGTSASVTFPSTDIFGQANMSIGDGETKVLTVQQGAPDGSHTCPIKYNEAQEGEDTPPVYMEIED